MADYCFGYSCYLQDNITEMKKDKLYIVTWQGDGNYGTSLQSYALCKFLRNQGYNAFYLKEFVLKDYPRKKIKIILHYLGLWNILNYFRHKPVSLKEKKLQMFNKKHYHVHEVFSKAEYNNLLLSAKVFITGSDQIWNSYHYFNPYFFLNFAKNEKRIAYASSIGPNSFPEHYKNEIKELLSAFCHIGLRESSAVETVKELIGTEHHVCSVLDPTFLLTKEHWNKLADEANIEICLPEKYILCYFIGGREEYFEYIKSIKNVTGIDSVILISPENIASINIPGALFYADAGPIEFVKLISEATLVCSDSFHASAMSINLEKQFVVFERFKKDDSKSQNSRIYDLMNIFNIRNSIYGSRSQSVSYLDYSNITPILKQKRKESVNFLLNSIEF